jgi:RNA-binding protein
MIDAPDPPVLTGRQRKFLRGKAHNLDAVVWVGQDGVSDGVLGAVDEALTTHELIKVRLREPEDKRGDAARLADGTKSVLCGLIGHTVVLYRPHPEQPRIVLE